MIPESTFDKLNEFEEKYHKAASTSREKYRSMNSVSLRSFTEPKMIQKWEIPERLKRQDTANYNIIDQKRKSHKTKADKLYKYGF